jgi:ABC-type siderophore export system fused ATPase/permease subunit
MAADSRSAFHENAKKYLAALHLSHKVRIEGESFSTTALSQRTAQAAGTTFRLHGGPFHLVS